MEDVKIFIILIIVYEFNDNVIFAVSEGAKISIFTFLEIVGIESTKLSFVFFGSIELLYSIVGLGAPISIWAKHRFFFCILA
jgi:hypothetical protein